MSYYKYILIVFLTCVFLFTPTIVFAQYGDAGAGEGGGGDSGYVPPDPGGVPAQDLTSVINAGCDGVYPLVRYDFTASWTSTTVKYEVWRWRKDLDNWTVIREVSAPGSYLDTRLDTDSYQAPYTEYAIVRVDTNWGRLDTNHLQINVQNCTTPPATPPPPPGGGGAPTPPPGGESVTLNSALNSSCSGIYPVVSVNFSSNFNPPGGYELWHINNPYKGWEVFKAANIPGTYTDDRADSNWYQGVTTYMVRAVDSSGARLVDSNNISMVTTNCNPPSSPRFIPPSPRAYCSTIESRITLSWTIPQNFSVNSGDRYYIQRVDGADNRVEYGPTELNSFEDGNVTSGQIYSYNIRAITQSGTSDSGWSSSVTSLNCNNPQVNLYVNNSRALVTVKTGTQAQIKWDSTNSKSCTASSSPSQASWNGVKPVSGTDTTGILTAPPSEIRYTLTCTNTDTGVTDTGNVDVKIEGQRPCLKTTGGDVHSNEGISAPEGCN